MINMPPWARVLLLSVAMPCVYAAADALQTAVDELLAADRAFSTAAAKVDVTTGLSAMFADDVMMPTPSGTFVEGKAAAVTVLQANADNATSHVEWTPVRGGISADGRHGFTLGFMTLRRADGTAMPLKYLAYWVKQPGGWRVAVPLAVPA
jgi:ketosteroid isomerase-like protein